MPTVEGINPAPVTAWLNARAPVVPPLTFELITGGHSNLTYRVTDAAQRRWVLRRPPLNSVLATAHDMGREHRIVGALAGTGVPVPPVVGLCTDETVNGAPFYVMGFVEGLVARDAKTAEYLDASARETASRNLVEGLVRLHSLEPEAVGLGDLGRKGDYVARQLRRWSRQVQALSARDLPLLQQVHGRLVDAIPPQRAAGIVHGDYRLDNCIIRDDGSLAAVLDWELCTLGDVRADVGMLLVYWAEPEDELFALASPPTTAPGFAQRRQLVDWYCEMTDRDLDDLAYFVAFSYWRLACILEGVYARYLSAAMGKKTPHNLDRFGRAVEQLAERAADILDGGPAV